MKAIFKKLNELSSRLTRSSLVSSDLKNSCDSYDTGYLKMPTVSQTRWNSHERVVNVVLRLKPVLITLIDSKEFQVLIPSEEKFGCLETLHPTLAFVKEINDKLSGEEETTIDKILPLIRGLRAEAQQVPSKRSNLY